MSPTFHSLSIRNYRIWFLGGLVSNIGTWAGRVGQDWLVLTELTDHSSTALGTVTGLQFLPILLLAPWAGAIADRYDKRRTLVLTQTGLLLTTLALGILATSLLALFGAFLFALQMGNIEQKTVYADEVIVSDAIIQKAARDTLSQQDDKTLTHRAVDAITTLHLDGTPASFEDLALFPALTRLEIPQSCVQAASQLLPEADFTIVVYPEEAHD